MLHVPVTPASHHSRPTVPPVPQAAAVQQCLVLQQKLDTENATEDIISRETHLWISTVSTAGIIPLLFLVGVPGNLLSAAVFYRLGLGERINFCIFCLAVVDLVVITSNFLIRAEHAYRMFFGSSNVFVRYLVGVAEFNKVSMFLSTVIAAERCLCVVSPLHAQRVLSTRTLAFIIISVSVILLAGVMVIAAPKHTEACVFDPQTNKTSFIFYVTEFYMENQEIVDLFDIFVYSTALPALCFVIIVVTTVITAVKLQSAVQWRQQSASAVRQPPTGSSTHQMVAVTRMLIGTSVLLIVCLSPILMVQMAVFLVPQLKRGGPYHNVVDIIFTIVNVFRCINSSFNFFIYYQMGSRFRQTLKELLICGLAGKHSKNEFAKKQTGELFT